MNRSNPRQGGSKLLIDGKKKINEKLQDIGEEICKIKELLENYSARSVALASELLNVNDQSSFLNQFPAINLALTEQLNFLFILRHTQIESLINSDPNSESEPDSDDSKVQSESACNNLSASIGDNSQELTQEQLPSRLANPTPISSQTGTESQLLATEQIPPQQLSNPSPISAESGTESPALLYILNDDLVLEPTTLHHRADVPHQPATSNSQKTTIFNPYLPQQSSSLAANNSSDEFELEPVRLSPDKPKLVTLENPKLVPDDEKCPTPLQFLAQFEEDQELNNLEDYYNNSSSPTVPRPHSANSLQQPCSDSGLEQFIDSAAATVSVSVCSVEDSAAQTTTNSPPDSTHSNTSSVLPQSVASSPENTPEMRLESRNSSNDSSQQLVPVQDWPLLPYMNDSRDPGVYDFVPNLPIQVHPTEVFNVVVSLALNPFDLYVQLQSDNCLSALLDIRSRLSDLNSQASLQNVNQGSAHSCKSYAVIDENFRCRAGLICRGGPDGEMAYLLNYDTGEMFWCHCRFLQPLDSELLHIPAQAVHCMLRGLDGTEQEIDAEIISWFRQTTFNRKLSCSFVARNERNGRYLIDLYLPEFYLAEKLITFAEYINISQASKETPFGNDRPITPIQRSLCGPIITTPNEESPEMKPRLFVTTTEIYSEIDSSSREVSLIDSSSLVPSGDIADREESIETESTLRSMDVHPSVDELAELRSSLKKSLESSMKKGSLELAVPVVAPPKPFAIPPSHFAAQTSRSAPLVGVESSEIVAPGPVQLNEMENSNSSSGRCSPEDRLEWDAQIETILSSEVFANRQGRLSVAVSPRDFYVHLADPEKVTQLQQLQVDMNVFYKKRNFKDPVFKKANVHIGSFWCVKLPTIGIRSRKDYWYRVKVLAFKDDDDNLAGCKAKRRPFSKIIVHAIDYGHTTDVFLRDIVPLTAGFIRQPAFAVCFGLFGVEPLGSDWTLENRAELIAVIGYKRTFDYAVVKHMSENCYEVKICRKNTTVNRHMDLNSLLVKHGVLKCLYFLAEANSADEYLSDDDDDDDDDDDEVNDDKEESSASTLNPNVPELVSDGTENGEEKNASDAEPKLYECQFFKHNGFCNKKDNCRFFHRTSTKEDISSGNTYLGLVENAARLPKLNACVYAELSSVFDPGHFYVMFPFGVKSAKKIYRKGSFTRGKTELDLLTEDMKIFYDKRSPLEDDLSAALDCGGLIVAKSNEDNFWYRAVLKNNNTDPNGPIEVFYIDFGNLEWVDRSNIRQIVPKFAQLPPQAIECILANIGPKDLNGWSEASQRFFRDDLEGKTVLLSVVDISDNVLYVELQRFEFNEVNVNISSALVGMGFAVPHPPELRLPRSQPNEVKIATPVGLLKKKAKKSYARLPDIIQPG